MRGSLRKRSVEESVIIGLEEASDIVKRLDGKAPFRS